MNEAPSIVATLTRQWAISAGLSAEFQRDGATFGICRWRHTVAEIEESEIPATLVLMRSARRSWRHSGARVEAAPSRRNAMGLLAAGPSGRWTFKDGNDGPSDFLHIYLPKGFLVALAQGTDAGGSVEMRDQLELHDRRLLFLASEIDAALSTGKIDRLYIDGLMTAIAARLLIDHSVDCNLRPSRGGLAPWQLLRLATP